MRSHHVMTVVFFSSGFALGAAQLPIYCLLTLIPYFSLHVNAATKENCADAEGQGDRHHPGCLEETQAGLDSFASTSMEGGPDESARTVTAPSVWRAGASASARSGTSRGAKGQNVHHDDSRQLCGSSPPVNSVSESMRGGGSAAAVQLHDLHPPSSSGVLGHSTAPQGLPVPSTARKRKTQGITIGYYAVAMQKPVIRACVSRNVF